MTTRDRILDEALKLFSVNGFEGVSVREIARAVGIKESSLYNHFKNKQAIFNAIVEQRRQETIAYFTEHELINHFKEEDMSQYIGISEEVLLAASMGIFEYYFADEKVVQFRRMLTIEQFKNEKMTKTYRELTIEAALSFQTKVFEMLVESGSFIQGDPEIIARQFFAPFFMLFYEFDNNAEGSELAREVVKKHVLQFAKLYGRRHD